jgi:release factor glutamine methyltransferase
MIAAMPALPDSTPRTLAGALRAAAASLPGAEARADAELLMAHALARPRAWLYAHGDDALEPEAAARFEALLQARRRGEPVAYLVGTREFWSMQLEVGPAVLVPRPETELLVELALERLPAAVDARVLDLGTGSGAIALALARERPRARVTAVDASASVLALAQRNAARLGVSNLHLLRSDWYSALGGERFDLIVSNPPYLADDDPHLLEGDLRFEPAMALSSGPRGDEALQAIVLGARAHLAAGAWLLFEHGLEQGGAARAMLAQAGLAEVGSWRDLEARERVSGGCRLD